MNSSWPKLINNHICNNHGGWVGGIETWGLSNANYYNNIIWGNTEFDGIKSANQVRISSTSSTPNFYNCIIQDGIVGIPDYNGQSANSGIDANGLDAEWTLSNTSQVINHGSNVVLDGPFIEADLMGNPRIIHGIIDIGAFEKQINSITVSGTINENTSWIMKLLIYVRSQMNVK